MILYKVKLNNEEKILFGYTDKYKLLLKEKIFNHKKTIKEQIK